MFKGFLSPFSFDFSLPLIFLSLLILQSVTVLFIQPKSVGNVKGRKQERVWDQPRPQGAFPFWGEGKSALGTRLVWDEGNLVPRVFSVFKMAAGEDPGTQQCKTTADWCNSYTNSHWFMISKQIWPPFFGDFVELQW